MRVLAPAKVNLTLDVLGVRPDGYHDLRSLVVPVSLFDEIALDASPTPSEDGLGLSVSFAGPAEILGSAAHMGPPDKNLITRAVNAMRRETGRRDGLAVTLLKRIPIGSGLGGGSADAAAVLRALNVFWRANLSRERLVALAAEIGSDVPSLVHGGAVWMTGRGERVVAAPEAERAIDLVLAFPGVFTATAAVYEKCVPFPLTKGSSVVDNIRHPSFVDASSVAAILHNALAAPAEGLYPGITRARHALAAAGALGESMTGSGSCVFGVARDEAHARAMAAQLNGSGLTVAAVRTCPVM